MLKFHSLLYGFIFCTVLIAFIGCGKNVPLNGRVTFSDDGSPLTAGTVCFATDTFYARGKLDDQGRYTLGFDKPGNGLPKGDYKVYVADATTVTGSYKDSEGDDIAIYSPLIAPKFTSKSTTDITANVTGSTKNFDFKVDRISAPSK